MNRLVVLFLYLMASMPALSQEMKYRVLFEFNRSIIPDSSKMKLVKLITSVPMKKVLIEGHCDSVGSAGYNNELSLQRANAVATLLSQNGIDRKIITTVIGYGKEKPLNDNTTDLERQENRRVMITFYPSGPLRQSTEVRKEETPKKSINKRVEVVDNHVNKEALVVGNHLVFENLLFEPGRHVLKESSKEVLIEVLNLLNENPALELEIQGHVCCTTLEADGYDWDTGKDNLSAARATMVYNFLVQHGIEEYRLTYKGYGGSQKINNLENTEELKRVNRRVEFNILAK